MKRANKGRFAKGNKGGPGRPRKNSQNVKPQWRLMTIRPPRGCDASVYLDWLQYGRWYATVLFDFAPKKFNGYTMFEVPSDEVLFKSYIQFKVEDVDGVKKCIPCQIRRVEEGPIHPDEAAICH